MKFKEVTLLIGQTLYDLAVQEYGHTDGLWLILEDNPGIASDLSSVPAPGTVVNVRLEVPELSTNNRAIAAEFARRGQKVASGMEATITVNQYATAGYWQQGYSSLKQGA
jgi:phage tail protein X